MVGKFNTVINEEYPIELDLIGNSTESDFVHIYYASVIAKICASEQ